GRIDVDAARDHHVALAIAKEEVAVRIEIADIARGDEALAIDAGAFLRLVVIGEIGQPRHAGEDLAYGTCRQLAAGCIEDAQLRPLGRLAYAAGPRKKVGAGRKRYRARFG